MLHRIRLEIDGENCKTIYRYLISVTAHGGYARVGKPTHMARDTLQIQHGQIRRLW